MKGITFKEHFGLFFYFFLGTCLLSVLGRIIPGLAKGIGDIMNEHIAGKSIKIFTGLTLLIAYFYAIRNIIKPREYGSATTFLVINPTNFLISLTFVASAINWGVALSSGLLFPTIANGKIFSLLIKNATEISCIAAIVSIGSWLLHIEPGVSKTIQPFESPKKIGFWLVFGLSTLFWVVIFIRIVQLANNA